MQNIKNISQEIWDKLFQIYNKYTSGNTNIKTDQLQMVIKQILKEDTIEQINYVTKNLFRLDSDNSGLIDFTEFANFLLKRHCGQIALQKFHKTDKISKSKEMKINFNEFHALLNKAYQFLNVSVSQSIASEAFRNEDTNKDGYITYIEYFKFIMKYICHSDKQNSLDNSTNFQQIKKPPQNQKEYFSRFRKYIWKLGNDLCYAFDIDKNGLFDIKQLTFFVKQIYKLNSDQEIDYLLFNIFQLGPSDSIKYSVFIQYLLYNGGQIGLAKFQKDSNNRSKRLNLEQFMTLFKTTFYRIIVPQFQKTFRIIFPAFFKKIDKDNDGWITFEQYLRWMKQFTSKERLFSRQYLVDQDDEENPKSKAIWEQKKIDLNSTTSGSSKFKFSNYDLANRVFIQTLKVVKVFDVNLDHHLDQSELTQFLRVLLKENQDQIFYFVKNIVRYDKDGDKKITYEEVANFFVQQHCGEIILQRLHRKRTYKKGANRIMNKNQFGYTLNLALSSIQIQATDQQINTLFNEIDLDKDGQISYSDYFLFLRLYFGSITCQKNIKTSQISSADQDGSKMNAAERIARLIRSQFRVIITSYDLDKNLKFDKNQITQILSNVFKLSTSEINYVLNKIFKLNVNTNQSFTYDQLLDLLLRIHIGQLMLKRLHEAQKFPKWSQGLLNFADFSLLLNNSVAYLKVLPDNNLLFEVFNMIDTNSDGWISYKQYFNFVSKYLGGGIDDFIQPSNVKPVPPPPKNSTNLSEQETFYQQIIGQLRIIYNRYDSNKDGHLSEAELESLVKQILQQTSKPQLDYIFRNLFRVDPNTDRKIQFVEFAPFIIKHSAELSLQRFHLYQKSGKKQLNREEFTTIVKNAFKFLKSIVKRDETIQKIFNSLDVNKKQSVSYIDLVNWVHLTLVKRVC